MTHKTIHIHTQLGGDWFAESSYQSGELAVHENWHDIIGEGWQITHIPTGLRICHSMKYRAAITCCKELDGIANWNFTEKEDLKKKIKAATIKRLKEIMKGHGATFNEEKRTRKKPRKAA